MPEIVAQPLLTTATVAVRAVRCLGRCAHRSAEEYAAETHLVFPYRGVFVRHLGSDDAVAEANQMLFFNHAEGYRVSHPVPGGDASLDIVVRDVLLAELTPRALLHERQAPAFRRQRLRIDPGTQSLLAHLRHRLQSGSIEPLEAENLTLTLVGRALQSSLRHRQNASAGRRALVDRVKLLLAGDLSRRWTLAELGAHLGHSPVYLTQLFHDIEGVPLYRYQLRLRLARALELLAGCDDLTALGLDLGFSSHSHFTTAFRQVYGQSPSAFRRECRF